VVKINGKKIKVGDWICFKSDYEQSGQVSKIHSNGILELFNDNGFGGDYLRYTRFTDVNPDDCWLE
jgi:hypothetical protein